MAYEYERKLKNRLLDLEFDKWEETAQFEREYRELERVYLKAKAFDEVIKAFEDSHLYTDEDVLEIIQEQLDELECADDER